MKPLLSTLLYVLRLDKLERNRLYTPLLELVLHILVYIFGAPLSRHLDDPALTLKLLHDRHTCLNEGAEALFDGLEIVICTTRGLATVQKTLFHDGFGAVEEEGEFGGAYGALKGVCLIEFTREAYHKQLVFAPGYVIISKANEHTIYQKQFFVILATLNAGLHCILQQLYCDFHWHNRALFDVRLDHLAELAARTVLLLTQKITGRQVLETVV